MKKLRSLLHPSLPYFATKLYEPEHPNFGPAVDTLQGMVDDIEEEVNTRESVSQALDYAIEEVKYVLKRLSEMVEEGKVIGNKDIPVFASAFELRLGELIKHIDNTDSNNVR